MCNVRIGFLFMEKYSGIKTVNASLVLDYEYIQMLRDADRKIPNPNKIIAQGGGQENMLSTPADITTVGDAVEEVKLLLFLWKHWKI